MWNIFYRKVHLLILTLCLIVVWGFSSYWSMPRLEDPILTQRVAAVVTAFPGASAVRVESLVTEKVEQELFEIEEIDNIRSTSRTGISTVILELKDRVSNVDEVWARVRDRLADLAPQLPEEAGEPEYRELEAKAYAMIVGLTWKLESPPSYAILRRKTKELADRLRLIKGTEKVDLVGDPDEEVVVEVNPADLSALGLTTQDLAQQIQASDAKVSAGRFHGSGNQLLIEPETELISLESVRRIPISFGSSGQFARLGNIAQIKKGIAEPPSELAIINGKSAVALAVRVDSNRRLDFWAKKARQTLEKFQQQLPKGIELELVFDQSRYVETRINGLFVNLLLGGLFVVATTLLMMGWKSALIVGSSLPLSVLMVLGIMNILEIPLHQMSVTGLVMALGLLIDNAIVVVDDLQHHLQQGLKTRIAIAKSVSFLAVPLVASTMTTIFTFMPNVLMTGSVGEFIGTVGASIILSLLSSLFLSLTVVPALYGRFYAVDLARGKKHSRKNWWSSGFTNSSLTRLYENFLNAILSRPNWGIVLALIVPLSGFFLVGGLERQLFPPAERDQFHIEMELQPQASLAQTRTLVEQTRQLLLTHPEVENAHWFVGENAPAFYYNSPKVRDNSANYAQAIVQLKRVAHNPELFQQLQGELSHAFPSAQILVRQLEQGPVVGAPIQLRLYGSDLKLLRTLGEGLRAELAQLSSVNSTRASLANTLPQLGLKVDEEQARLAGLNNAAIAQQINNTVEGSLGGTILEGTEELPIRVRLSNSVRGDLNQISSLKLLPNNAGDNQRLAIPLAAVSKIELVPRLAGIPRRNGQRVNTVEAFIDSGVLPSTVLIELKQRLQESNFQLPPGYFLEFGGEFEERSEAISNLFSTVPIFLVLMVASLVLSFSSFRLAGIIIVVGICSVGLGFVSLWLFGYPLGFMALLGTAGLVGLAINDSIVVLAALHADPLSSQGKLLAIRQVIVRSTRHVLATTITTIAGLMPLLVNGGSFWPPLAIAMVGGVGGATLLALFFVPCAYLIQLKRNN